MNNTVSISFGEPQFGWLPVDFHYKDFNLNFDASDSLNDPIEELYVAVTKLQNNESKRITWWLEPVAYFFDFERKGQIFFLTIIETKDIHDLAAVNLTLIKITGVDKEIFEPFRIALRQFYSRTCDENHWPYNLNEIKNL